MCVIRLKNCSGELPKEKDVNDTILNSKEGQMKSRAKADWGLAIALGGLLPSLNNGYQIALIVLIAILAVAASILLCYDRFSTALWKQLVKTAKGIEIGDTALAFGLCGLGIALLQNQWLLPGIIALLAGAFFIGRSIMMPLTPLLRRPRR